MALLARSSLLIYTDSITLKLRYCGNDNVSRKTILPDLAEDFDFPTNIRKSIVGT